MSFPEIKYCPGTLAPGFNTYSRTCLNRLFKGKNVSHILPYDSPESNKIENDIFLENRKYISISGVQEKYSIKLDKNKLRLIHEEEQGEYILKPIPYAGKKPDQMPANEHLTMQIARQIFKIETAENALIFFKNGVPAYITKRFDINEDGSKIAQEDFASLAGRTPQTHGENYKYSGNYLELFNLLKSNVPAYTVEAPKLLKILIFNYLFSNGDAHFKNFSLSETTMGDYSLSPAYDLINSRIHIADSDFALKEGLLPKKLSQGNIKHQFEVLSYQAGIKEGIFNETQSNMLIHSESIEKMISSSFLNESTKRNYWQSYQGRIKQLLKE